MTALSWKTAAVRAMAHPQAPRVFDRNDLGGWLSTHGFTPPLRTLLRTLQEWEAAGLVQRVAQGLYLNRQAHPLPLPAEAAHRVRPGAVLSLAYVLGRAGVLNNPTHWVTATVPSTSTKGPQEVETDDGSVFRFAYVRPDLLPVAGQAHAKDALEAYAPVPTATPEKALLDWLYLASSARGAIRWPLPPQHDWDVSGLDEARLQRLAVAMGMEETLSRFLGGLSQPTPRVSLRPRRHGP